MENNALALVLKNDWLAASTEHTYNGKYTVGRFHLTDAFIVEYMKLMHEVEIPNSWVCDNLTNISDTVTLKVMYMEGCDILTKNTMNEIRNAVKSPSVGVKIYHNGKKIVKIKFMEDHNEVTN